MTVAVSPDLQSEPLMRRTYKNPPIHEVILDLLFQDAIEDAGLERLRTDKGLGFGTPEPMNEISVTMASGSVVTSQVHGGQSLVGWQFTQRDPHWVLRIKKNQVSLHAVRSDNWPRGEYIGWDAILARFQDLNPHLHSVFEGVPLKRCGLRYVNRIAVPVDTDLDKWFTLRSEHPPQLSGLHSLNVAHMWTEVEGFGKLAASLKYGRIQGPIEGSPEGTAGVLLDIDLFNFLIADAPNLADAPEWFVEAHAAENMLFEGCVTDALRGAFNEEG